METSPLLVKLVGRLEVTTASVTSNRVLPAVSPIEKIVLEPTKWRREVGAVVPIPKLLLLTPTILEPK